MTTIEKALDALSVAVDVARQAVLDEATRLEQTAASASGGAIMPVTQCTLPQKIAHRNPISSFSNQLSYLRSWRACVAEARRELTAARDALETQHAANEAALANNKLVRERVKLLMANLGIAESRSTFGYATPRARKMTTQTVYAGYLSDLNDVCKITDGYEACNKLLVDFEERIASYEKAEQDKEASELREKETKRRKSAHLATLGALAFKYRCGPVEDASDADAVLEAILACDKYLHLAYWLERNRNDWNDGPSFAKHGLNGFAVQTDEDAEIAQQLGSLVHDWGGDGRVFRDHPLGYNYLYTKVGEELLKDLSALRETGFLG